MQTRSRNRREAIVGAARNRFTTLGYDGTTIGDLATELDISKAAIAYYFPTKDTFLDEFVTPFLDDLEQRMSDATDPAEAMHAYLGAIIDHHDIATWVDTDAALQHHPEFGGRLAKINATFASLVVGRSRKKSDRIRALSVLGGLWRPARELSTPELTAHYDEVIEAALTSG